MFFSLDSLSVLDICFSLGGEEIFRINEHEEMERKDIDNRWEEHGDNEEKTWNQGGEGEEDEEEDGEEKEKTPEGEGEEFFLASGVQHSGHIVPVTIEEELKTAYLDYAMSVIISRALPDARDGLKPVQRRILYTMGEEGFEPTKPHKKSANVVGQVIYKYHPHGTDPIYGTLVRLAQTFAMGIPLVDGHGNFGSVDGDKAAAMRYTEVRLAPITPYILEDYDRDTVDFQWNYDNTFRIPGVLPARFPNLLVNGATGIAVGMATNIPPHNLQEVMEACCALLEDPEADLLHFIKGPDFPTGGIIFGTESLKEMYETGRGSFLIRSKVAVEEIRKDRFALVVTEIPYQVNKADLVERIAYLVNNKDIEGISTLRDESDRQGMRIVIELKRDAIAQVVLNQLFAMTSLQISYSMNMVALDKGLPIQMNLKRVLQCFLDFRWEVVRRRTRFFLRKAKEKAHMLFGLLLATDFIDEIIALIKKSADAAEALENLCQRSWTLSSDLLYYLEAWEESCKNPYTMTPEQGKHILALPLRRLTSLEQEKLQTELKACHEDILHFQHLLNHREAMKALIREEFLDIMKKFPQERRTALEVHSSALTKEDLIAVEDMVVTVSVKGYIKRVPLSTYRSQRRGGRGRSAMETREEDAVSQVFVADTHTLLLFFTTFGKAYQLKVHELPMGGATGKGRPLIGLFPLEEREQLATLLPLPRELLKSLQEDHDKEKKKRKERHLEEKGATDGEETQEQEEVDGNMVADLEIDDLSEVSQEEKEEKEEKYAGKGPFILFATNKGTIRKNALKDFLNIRSGGKIAMKLEAGESLVGVSLGENHQDVVLSSLFGKSIRFPIGSLRQFFSRSSTGVRGISLKKGDEVVSMSLLQGHNYTMEDIVLYRSYKGLEEDQESIEKDHSCSSVSSDERDFANNGEGGQGESESSLCEEESSSLSSSLVSSLSHEEKMQLMEQQEEFLLSVSEKGYGKRTSAYDYRRSRRGGQGVATMNITFKTGKIVNTLPVEEHDELILLMDEGQLLRCPVKDIRIAGRKTQGVKLCRLEEEGKIVSVALFKNDRDEEEGKGEAAIEEEIKALERKKEENGE